MIFRKSKTEITGSLNYLAWQRFKNNKLSLLGLLVILVTVIIGIPGYLITPDKTSFANTQILEISTKKPGFKCEMLKIRKNETNHEIGILKKMISGKIDEFTYIPINNFRFENNKLILEEFNNIANEEATTTGCRLY